MTANQLTRAMTALGITQLALASKLETDTRSVRRWMKGEWPVPAPVSLLINLMVETNTPLDNLKA
jgi:transcriptional regulator with XRE-family HTH domain